MNDFLLPAVLLIGLIVGAFTAWLVIRSRATATTEAAVSKAESAAQAELVQLRERVRAADESRRETLDRLAEVDRQFDGARGELDGARREVATLAERASRVPILELELQRLEQIGRDMSVEATRLARESAENSKAAGLMAESASELRRGKDELENKLETVEAALNQASERKAALEELVLQLEPLRQELTGVNRQLDERNSALNTANERKAGLEEQVLQLEPLRLSMETATQKLEATAIELNNLRETSAGEVARLISQTETDRESLVEVRGQLEREQSVRLQADGTVNRLTSELREARIAVETDRSHAAERLRDLLAAKEALTDQFKSLATDILEEKSKRFAEQNQVSLGQLLDPLKIQLTEFRGKVEEVYINEGKDRSALAAQVKELVGLNQALSQDAKNLTSALKGSSKTQGNWGELILERVLEASGLRKDHEYVVQDSQRNEDGSRLQPDVVVNLPGERRLVVDAKVSLVAYEQYVSAETDEARALALRRHLESVRAHIKLLSEKKYQQLYQLQTLDFVLMFVPVEPAFMAAVTNDDSLFMNAWERNVLLVSPSTLLFVVRTVAHLWRQEAQSRNAQDIAKRGAELYDKLVDFVRDLENVGEKLNGAQKSYLEAHKRLATGRGNIIRQADMLRSLGVKPTKQIAQPLVEASHDELVVGEAPTLDMLPAKHSNALTDLVLPLPTAMP